MVKISTFSDDRYYIIEIIDDGVGFDSETYSFKNEGHVGVAHVESRIKRMCRGSMEIKSTLGVGTRVTVKIPRRKGDKS